MKKRILFINLLVFAAISVHAQSAQKLGEMISSEKLTKGQVAYLSATYQKSVSDDASEAEAFEALVEQGFFTYSDAADDVADLGTAAFLCARATDLKGGLFYTLFHNARYAFKELKAKGVLPPEADPSMTLNGRDAIAIMNGCIELRGKE